MKLALKFNLVFLLIFLSGLAIVGYVSRELLQRNAREEILHHARIMMEAALAVRSYTNTQVKPLLDTQLKYTFLPQSVPAYAAAEYFGELRKNYPEYSYKEATLNPTNPRNRATDWESDVVHQFRQNPTRGEMVGVRDTPDGKALYMARPMQIKNEACLYCHSTVDAAPKTMLDRYGTANGFGWKLNEVIGAQIVSVPMSVPIDRANQAFKVFMASLAGVFVVIFIALNLMLYTIVVRPVANLAKVADQVSMGDLEAPDFPVKGKDEIAKLSDSFNRMRKSLVKAMKMLEE
jgi:protein-histidine pros-kinase